MPESLSKKINQESLMLKLACPQSQSTQNTMYGVQKTTTYHLDPITIPIDRPEKGTLISVIKCPGCSREITLKIKSLKFSRMRKWISFVIFLSSFILIPVFIINSNNIRNEFLLLLLALGQLINFVVFPVSFFLAIYYNFNLIAKKGLSIKFPIGHRLLRGKFLVS
jgi:hypothetical protein